MSLPKTATIRVYNRESEWRFAWSGFDGDDCFENFCITINDRGRTRRFELGGAVVWSLRWLNRFFENKSLGKTQGGRIDVYRDRCDFRLILESDGANEEFDIQSPEVILDCEFLRQYDGDDET